MRRREFLHNTSAAAALALTGSLGLQSFTSPEKKKHITILHTNDVHSHIDPFGPNDGIGVYLSARYLGINSCMQLAAGSSKSGKSHTNSV